MTSVLSHSEAVQFVTQILHININKHNQLELLNEIILAMHEQEAFQTLSNMAIEPDNRHIPTPQEIIAAMFSRRGGLCTSFSYFNQQLLSALNYKSSLVAGTVGHSDSNNHAIVTVRDVLTPGDVYLVETGFGYATFQAIPLSFSTQSPVYKDSFQPYKYVRLTAKQQQQQDAAPCNDDSTAVFARMHCSRHLLTDAATDADWTQVYSFSLQSIQYDYIAQLVNESVYRNMSDRMSCTIRLIRWPSRRAVVILNRELLREDKSQCLQSTLLDTDEQLVATILHEFPTFDEHTVRQAVNIWNSLPAISTD